MFEIFMNKKFNMKSEIEARSMVMKHGILYQQGLAVGRSQPNGNLVFGRVGGKEVAEGHIISYKIKYCKVCVYSVYCYGQYMKYS